MKDDVIIYETLEDAIEARFQEWDAMTPVAIPPSFYGNELAGEIGEACNIVKKLDREMMGLPGSRATVRELGDELADGLICLKRLAAYFNIPLDEVAKRKFNATSEKVGLRTRVRE
jgi:NTP pyrophosphatase (non-canonical NTP hydrolase)